MSIATFIRDKTDDGRNIVRFLIDVMDGDLEGCTLSHRLAAARLLTIYGHNDAPDFIADNTPDQPEIESGRKSWIELDPGIRALIRERTDNGRVNLLFLIDVVEGRIEGIHVGHRVSVARELLNRAFEKVSFPRRREPGRPLTKAKRSNTPRYSTQSRAGRSLRLPRLPPSRPALPSVSPPAGLPRTQTRE